MLAAEAGADYVMFGEPDDERPPAVVRGRPRARRMVGGGVRNSLRRLCRRLDEIAPLVQAGADFVAVGDFVFDDPRGPAARCEDARRRSAVPEAAG